MPDHGRSTKRSPRHRMRLRVAINGVNCFAVNLGPGGFCTEMMRVFPAGTLVEGTILLDGRNRPFKGRVAWARAGDFRMNLTGRMGVEFLDVAPELEGAFPV